MYPWLEIVCTFEMHETYNGVKYKSNPKCKVQNDAFHTPVMPISMWYGTKLWM